MRHLGKVDYKGLVANGLTEGDGQLHFRLLEFTGSDDGSHGYHGGIFVGNFDTDGSLARYGSDDSDAQSGQRQGDIVFQVLDLGNPYTRFRYDFV